MPPFPPISVFCPSYYPSCVSYRRAGKCCKMSSSGIRRIRSFIWGAVQQWWAEVPTQTRRTRAWDALFSLQWRLCGCLGDSRGIETQDGPWEEIHLRHLRTGLPHQVLPQQAPAQSSQSPEGPGGFRVRLKWAGPLSDLSLLPSTKYVSTWVIWLPDSPVCICLFTGGCWGRSKWSRLWRKVTYLLKIFLQSLSFLGQSWAAHRKCSVFGNNFASRLFLFVILLRCIPYFCHRLPYDSYFFYFRWKLCARCLNFSFIKKRHEGFMSIFRCEVMFGMLSFVFDLCIIGLS